MRRAIIFFIEVAIVAALAVWLANRPGVVAIDWQGWRVETSLGVMALILLVVVVLAASLYAGWRWLRRKPGELLASGRHRREAAGYRALTDGLAAVAAGDAAAARKLVRKADSLLNAPPLTLLLSAQAAQLDGDEATAQRCFEQMLERPETEFLGLRGLILQALRDDDDARALDYAQRAYPLQPSAPWLLDTLVSLHSKAGRWRAAQKLVEEAQRRKRLPAEVGRRHQAALLTERAHSAFSGGSLSDAFEQVRKAHDLDPAHPPAAELLARLVADDGRARKVLERTWRVAPHPVLSAAYLDIVGDVPPLDRYRAISQLTKENTSHPESRFAIAEAAVTAKLWGEAKQQLDALETAEPTARVYRMWARLAEAETQDDVAARRWIERAAEAEADKAWVCASCGTVSDDWSAVCGHCGSFATLSWKQPPRVHRAVIAPPIAAGAPAAGEVEPAVATPIDETPEVEVEETRQIG
ncbi:MAG: heme biosynthesis protein HemY [Alphaproteobacteria bacterium]|nr:heme biosynthesis protein HemY [Alphaproteobacteria bacterium]